MKKIFSRVILAGVLGLGLMSFASAASNPSGSIGIGRGYAYLATGAVGGIMSYSLYKDGHFQGSRSLSEIMRLKNQLTKSRK